MELFWILTFSGVQFNILGIYEAVSATVIKWLVFTALADFIFNLGDSYGLNLELFVYCTLV